MITSTVSSKGQTTLPKQVRDALHIEPGKQLIYEIEDDQVIVRTHPGIHASAGALKAYIKKPLRWQDERKISREEWSEHVLNEGLIDE